jgi:putative endonuclease
MYYCYILFSKKLDKFYIGETVDIEQRIYIHNTGGIPGAYTSKTDDWQLHLKIECNSRLMARRIEEHIKRMKSRKYIENLLLYPEMIKKLQQRYYIPGSSR